MQRKNKAGAPRVQFEVKFVNGVWTVFNRHTFNHGPALRTEKMAHAVCGDLNAGRLQWTAR